MRYALALDLIDDEELIARYEAHHVKIWPEVRNHLHQHGVLAMEIYRLGTRLFMVMETDDAVYSPEAIAQATQTNEAIARWETLMWTFQAPTPWTQAGEKWVPMKRIFDLDKQHD